MSARFLAAWREPATVLDWGVPEWADMLPRFRAAGLLAHFGERLKLAGVATAGFPPAVQRQLAATASSAWVRARSARWECGELALLFAGSPVPMMLLKGASYLLTGALPGKGRFLSDLDLLVPRAAMPMVAERLAAGDWVPASAATPEAEYFEHWLHQLPAYQHRVRHAMLDLHHTVIARWGGHVVDTGALFAAAVPTGVGQLLAPSPLDRCLIVAAHFVRSDAASGAFRDLLDLDALITEAVPPGEPLDALEARAREIGLWRALSIATHFAAALFGTRTVGRAPTAVGLRAALLVPDGVRGAGLVRKAGRRLQRIGSYRATLPLRVMVGRALASRLKLRGPAKPLVDQGA
jgi:hypothetical protein